MKENKSILLAGPWVGEFGWELFCWQGYIRKQSRLYDKTIVIGKDGHQILYEDFCDEYIIFNPDGVLTDGWRCYDQKRFPDFIDKIKYTTYIDGNLDLGYLSNNKTRFFTQQEFYLYSSKSRSEKVDILFHCRNKSTGDDRNWPKEKWNKLYKILSSKYSIASIGDRNAFHIEGTLDLRQISLDNLISIMQNSRMIVGPSSGPMHLASLCGLKHLVWSDSNNEGRYKTEWNPFDTDVVFYSKDCWNPEPKLMASMITNELEGKKETDTINNKYKITVVTVTYNEEESIEDTIKSVVSQDYSNVEYIIIDGGSTDKTVEIIKKYEEYIAYWVSEADKGLYHAMNKGIDVATGDWINFLNSGDKFISKSTLSLVAKQINEGNFDILCGDILRGIDFREYRKPLGLKHVYDHVFVNHQASYTKLSIAKKVKFNEDMKISSDYGFFLKCYLDGYRFQYIDEPLAKNSEGGVSQQNNIRAWSEAMYLQAQYLENPKDIFNNKFYKNLVNTPNYGKVFSHFLNDFNQKQEISLKDKKFVLYGFGSVGQLTYERYKDNILFIVDNNYKQLTDDNIFVYSPDILKDKEFEYIYISVLGREEQIKSFLINNYDVAYKKILTSTIYRVDF